jgi:hypothetical protein
MFRDIIVVLSMVVSFTFAQQDQTKTQTVPQPAAAPAAVAPVKEKASPSLHGPAKILAGSIVSINLEKRVVSVKVKSGTYPISIDEKTVVLAGGQPAAFADLKKGDEMHVEYQKVSKGQRVAVRVTIPALKTAPKAAAQAAPKKEAVAPKAAPATPANPEAKAAVLPVIKADTAAAAKPAAKTLEPTPVKK